MQNKIIAIVLLVVLVACICLTFSACGGEVDDMGLPAPDTTAKSKIVSSSDKTVTNAVVPEKKVKK